MQVPANKPMDVTAASALGVGAMIGAGIFALMGEAGAIAGSAVWLSFVIGGVVALLSGYSMARLGARYPSAGGIVEYLVQAWGPGLFSGAMGIMLYIAALVALALISKTFGSYAVTFFEPGASRALWVDGFANAIIILFVIINLRGADSVARWEKWIVAAKVLVLTGFAGVGLYYAKPELLSPGDYPPLQTVFFSLAITFFAFEGFRVITNSAEDMPDPQRTLPRAMILSIVLVMGLYIVVAFAVFGNLSLDQVVAAKDFALAEAARPVFGQLGFTIVALAALVSTASAINANLYAVTNVTWQLARDGELPAGFGKPIAGSREGLLISAGLIILLSDFLNLSEIAAVGSMAILVVHLIVHIGHLRIRSDTGIAMPWVLMAILAVLVSLLFAVLYALQTSPAILVFVVISLLLAFVTEALLHRFVRGRIGVRAD